MLTEQEKEMVLSLNAPRLFGHVENVCRYGPRPDGTMADTDTVAYIENELDSCGAEVIKVKYDIAISRHQRAILRVVAPEARDIECRVFGRSTSTSEDGILTNRIVFIGSGVEHDDFDEHIPGALILVREGGISPHVLERKLAQKGAMGCIFIRRRPDNLIATHSLGRYGSEIPMVGISWHDGEFVLSLLAQRSLTLHLRVHTDLELSKVANVIGTIRGQEHPDEVLLICAHRDTVPGSPGANDNASGVAVILELVRILATRRLKRTLCGVFLGGGEGGSFGARDLLKSEVIKSNSIKAVINLDELGFGPVLKAVASGVSSDGRKWRTSKAINDVLVHVGKDLGYQLDDTFSGQMGDLADAQPFVEAGIPTAWLSKGAGYAIKHFGHTSDDVPDKLEINALKIPADILIVALLRLDAETRH